MILVLLLLSIPHKMWNRHEINTKFISRFEFMEKYPAWTLHSHLNFVFNFLNALEKIFQKKIGLIKILMSRQVWESLCSMINSFT